MESLQVLDHGYIKLIEFWGTDERVIESARMSVGRGFIGWDAYKRCKRCDIIFFEDGTFANIPDSTNGTCESKHGGCDFVNMPNGDTGLLRTLYNNRHTTPFEMCGATFEIQAPIMVFREWHRHRTQSYSEMSARYAPLPDMNYMPTVERLMMSSTTNKQAAKADFGVELTPEAAEQWLSCLEDAYRACEDVYQAGLKLGVPKELARLIVPVGRYSRMRASANLLNWLRFLTLRLPDSAQWEIRQYAGGACEMLSERFNRTMGLFGEELIKRAA